MDTEWFYRVFGHDFGPVPLKELVALAKAGAVSPDDEVRRQDLPDWVAAHTIPELGLTSAGVNPAETEPAKPKAAGSRSNPTIEIPANDNWFYRWHGQEFGPLPFDNLIELARQGQLEISDEVRFGTGGKWRQAGSIGRLMTAMPEQSLPERVEAAPAKVKQAAKLISRPAPEPISESPQPVDPPPTDTTSAVTEPAVSMQAAPAVPDVVYVPVDPALPTCLEELEFIKAQAAFDAVSQASRQLVSWAFDSNRQPEWWGVVSGVQLGPVDFNEVMSWANSGRLQPTDFVRNGLLSQFVQAASLPGLFQAVLMTKPFLDALRTAESRAEIARAAAKLNPRVLAMVTPAEISAAAAAVESKRASIRQEIQKTEIAKSSVPALPIPEPMQPPEPSLDEPPIRPIERPYVASTPAQTMPTRPIPAARSQAPKRSSSPVGRLLSNLLQPRNVGGAAIAACVLWGAFWFFTSEGAAADVNRYKELKEILDEVHKVRDAKSTDFTLVKKKAIKVGATIVKALQRQRSARWGTKKTILLAAKEDLPRMIYGDLETASEAEQKFDARLVEVAAALGVKK